jgi:hypothetical protein
MAHSDPPQVVWLSEPEDHDYPAAADYLDLLLIEDQTQFLVDLLREAPVIYKKAKDILRASELPILPVEDPHVAKDLKKISEGKRLSPVLLVRSNPLVVADGYHRICACYHIGADTEIPCKLV